MTQLVVAVSGGVDSVVLLDKLVRHGGYTLVVAHFDHGIRTDSDRDADFVRELADSYGLICEVRREELGPGASEELARERRYAFLWGVARRHEALLVTAHHADDVVETIAINLTRGTGWRGLAVLQSPGVIRPLLHMSKEDIRTYAEHHQLTWHEDSTNLSSAYLRNRIRSKAQGLSADTSRQLVALRDQQVAIRRRIEEEVHLLLGNPRDYQRHLFIMIPEDAADELLRAICINVGGSSPTRPQRRRALLQIKVAQPGTVHQVGSGFEIRISRTTFAVRFIA